MELIGFELNQEKSDNQSEKEAPEANTDRGEIVVSGTSQKLKT